MDVIDSLLLQIHDEIKIVRHIFTVFSILFAIPAISVIIICWKGVSKRYSTLLAFIVLLGVASDIILQLVWDPLMLLPAICVIRESPLIPIPGGPNLYHELWSLIIASNIPVYAACFMERHQAVQTPGSRWLLPPFLRHISSVSIAVITLALMFMLRMARMSSDSEQVLVQTLIDRWPSVNVLSAKCYDYVLFIFYVSFCVGGLILGVFYTALISWHTFSRLRLFSSAMSERKKAFNDSMTKVLIIQATFPLVLVVFPFIFSLSAVIAHAGGPLPYSLCFLFISAHSSTHSIVVLTVTPIYRTKLIEMVKRIIGRNNVQKFSVRSVASFTN